MKGINWIRGGIALLILVIVGGYLLIALFQLIEPEAIAFSFAYIVYAVIILAVIELIISIIYGIRKSHVHKS